MIELYGFGKNIGLLDGSPFVMKIHTFLKVAGLDYKSIGNPLNVRKSPKGKLPYIKDDGQTVSDSQFIIEYLSEKYNIDLNSHLSEAQKANAYLLTKSLDESLYWCIVWSRWQHNKTWNTVKKDFSKDCLFRFRRLFPTKFGNKQSRHCIIKESDVILKVKSSLFPIIHFKPFRLCLVIRITFLEISCVCLI